MLSESQERMLIITSSKVASGARVKEAAFRQVGPQRLPRHRRDDKRRADGPRILDEDAAARRTCPVRHLLVAPPLLQAPGCTRPSGSRQLRDYDLAISDVPLPDRGAANDVLLAPPGLSKHREQGVGVYRQYDHQVQTNTVVGAWRRRGGPPHKGHGQGPYL